MQVTRVMAKLEPGGAQLGAFWLSVALKPHGIESCLLAGTATREGIALAEEYGFDVKAFAPTTDHGSAAAGRGAAPDDDADLQWTPSEAFAAWLGPRLAGADLVHAHMFGGWWAAAHAVGAQTPLVASEHNALRWPRRAFHREAREALRRVDRFFAHGPASEAYVRALGLPPERLERGVSTFPGLGSRPRPGLPTPRVVFVGRLAREKGPDLLIEALGRLPEAPPAFLLGEGPLREGLERRARELGVGERVEFCGWCPEPGEWVAGASVLAAPSREEAWSQTVAMAMALGTPVVGTAVEGLPDLLAHDRGILVPPEDPEALAAAIADVVAGRRRPDLEAARRYACAFTPERMGELYAARYREAVGARR